MKTPSAAFFARAVFLILLTNARPSTQDTGYNPGAFSNWNDLRSCAQGCLAYTGPLYGLGCQTNECICRADIIPQAVSIASKCASSTCSNTNDVVSVTSFYEAYCGSATDTAAISLITQNPPSAGPGVTVTGTITATVTTTLANGQATVIGNIIYQYGNDDNIGGSQGNGNVNNGNPTTNGPAISSQTISSPVVKNGAVRQATDFLQSVGGWSICTWVTAVMVLVT